MFSYSLRSLRSNLTRFIATALAIILGIGFLSSGLMLTDAVKVGLTGNVEERYRHVDLAVTANNSIVDLSFMQGVPGLLLTQLRSAPGVAAAAGEMEANVRLLDDDGLAVNLRTMGRGWIADDELNPLTLTDGRAPTSDDEVVISRDLAKSAGVGPGDHVELETPAGPLAVDVTGISRFGPSDAIDDGGTISFTERAAPDVLTPGTDTYRNLILRTSGDPERIRDEITPDIPASVIVRDHDEFIEDATRSTVTFINFLRPVLQGFAYLAMFIAGFVIFNTFSVVVTQRYRELALIRAIGGSPKQVRRSLLLEGLVIGVVSSAVGVVLGTGLAKGLQLLLAQFGLALPGTGVRITTGTIILSMVVGTIVTLLSVMIPAFRAGRTKPVEAMRQSAVDASGTSVIRAVIGGFFLVASLVLLGINALGGARWFLLGPGSLLLFVGLFVGGPLLARLFGRLLRPVMSLGGLTGQLAADNVVRNPKRTATTANALVIGLFLVTLVTVSGEAMKSAVVTELNKLSSSDFIVASEGAIAPGLVTEIEGVDGVAASAPVRSVPLTAVDGTELYVSGVDMDELAATTQITVTQGSLDDVTNGTGAATADLGSFGGTSMGPDVENSRLGESLTITGADGEPFEFRIVALYEAKLDSMFLGDVVSPQTLEKIAGDQPVKQVFIRVEPGAENDVGARLEKVTRGYTGIEILPGNIVGQMVGQAFDFLIGAVNALLAMSIIVALVGIVNTMTLAIFERRPELGVIRALGMTRRQVGRMIRMEAVLMGLMGTVIGMSAGIFLSWILISSVPEIELGLSFNWLRVGLIFATGLLVGIAASIVPARRATRLDMLEAIRSE